MRLHRALLVAAALTIVTAPSFAADAPPACPPHAGWGMGRLLTPEQRIMRFELIHRTTANMTDDQRRAWHQSERAKFEAMSEAERQKYAADLTTQWNALPADRQAALRTQAEQFRAEHAGMGHPDGCR